MRKLAWTIPALILPLAACSSGGTAADVSASATADSSEITIVASTQVWADVADAVTDLDVNPIIQAGAADPHSFEPSASDMASIEEADIIIVGGGGYDSWLYDSLDAGDTRIIHAMELTGHDHDHDHGSEAEDHSGHDHEAETEADAHTGHDHGYAEVDNEHIWYNTGAVSQVAEDLAGKILELDPAATVTPEAVTERMDDLHGRIHDLPEARIAQTEPIADHLLSHAPMVDSTPAGYRATTLSEGEPTAADVAAFQELINEGGIDILIYNPQSGAAVGASLRDLAAERGIAVVEIPETPDTGENFFDVFTRALDDLAAAAPRA